MNRLVKVGIGLLGAAVVGLGSSRALGSRPENPAAHGPLEPCRGVPNCTHTQVHLNADPEAVRDAVAEAVRADEHWFTGRARTITQTDAGLTAVFRAGPFDDDLAAAVEPWSGGSVLTIRSASRLGRSDLGVNKMRVDRLVEAVRSRLGA